MNKIQSYAYDVTNADQFQSNDDPSDNLFTYDPHADSARKERAREVYNGTNNRKTRRPTSKNSSIKTSVKSNKNCHRSKDQFK